MSRRASLSVSARGSPNGLLLTGGDGAGLGDPLRRAPSGPLGDAEHRGDLVPRVALGLRRDDPAVALHARGASDRLVRVSQVGGHESDRIVPRPDTQTVGAGTRDERVPAPEWRRACSSALQRTLRRIGPSA
jgi:hypothetical protein